jgi:hypothetical protein
MAELTLLQDDVPCFPDEQAFAIIRAQIGRPLEEVFTSISERPIAAASLAQVGALATSLPQPQRLICASQGAASGAASGVWNVVGPPCPSVKLEKGCLGLVFTSISERPIAAASLAQVGALVTSLPGSGSGPGPESGSGSGFYLLTV